MSRELKESGLPWAGLIPSDWSSERGKTILNLMQRPVRKDDEVVTCFRDGEVILRRLRREEGFTMSDKEIGYQGINEGDIVIHGMDGFAGAIGVSKSTGKSTPVYVVCTPKENTNANYVVYYMRALAQNDVFLALSTGIRERSCDLKWNKISVLPFLVPPIKEQQAIADFLDTKCTELDDLVKTQERFIEELKAYKQSVITETVTKGLDPNVEMKNSGVDWIDKVPRHWEVRAIKTMATLKSGDNLTALDIRDENIGFPVYGGNGLRGYYTSYTNEGDYALIGRQGALCGNINYAHGKFWATDHAVVCYPKTTFVLGWFGESLRAMNLNQYSLSAAQPGLSVDRIKDIKMLVPPLSEQQSIADYLDKKCSEIDQLIAVKQQKIEELKDYKKSLIYEYVTGKKQVI